MRSRHDQVIGGVGGGIAEYLDVDPTLVRIAIVVLALVSSGVGVLVYIGAWIIMPESDAPPRTAAGAAYEPAESSSTGLLVWGLLLILVGVLALLWQLDVELPPWDAVLAGVLIALGLLILVGSRRGMHGGLVTLAVIVTLLLGAASVVNLSINGAFGDRYETVTSAEDLDESYGYAFGQLTLDLRDMELEPGTTELSTSIVFGQVRLRLPDDVGVRAESTTLFGSTQLPGQEHSAFSIDAGYTSPNYAEAETRLHLDIATVFGSTQVQQ